MDEVLKLAKYLTLHIAAMDAKYSFIFTNTSVHGFAASQDSHKLMDIAKLLEKEIESYMKGDANVPKS